MQSFLSKFPDYRRPLFQVLGPLLPAADDAAQSAEGTPEKNDDDANDDEEAFAYVGCFINEPGSGGHVWHKSFTECHLLAGNRGMDHFGMEDPHNWMPGHSQCLPLNGPPNMMITNDTECEGGTDADGHRLGGYGRLAVYKSLQAHRIPQAHDDEGITEKDAKKKARSPSRGVRRRRLLRHRRHHAKEKVFSEAAALAHSYALYMGPGSEYCTDGVLSESLSSGQSDCEQRCSDSTECKYISLWLTGGVNWCRLTTGCTEKSAKEQHTISVYAKREEQADSLSADEDDVQEVLAAPLFPDLDVPDEDMNTSKADMNTSKADSLSADEDDVQEVHGDEDMDTSKDMSKVIEKWIEHKREWIENKTNVEWLHQYGVMNQMRSVLSSEGNGGVESGSTARQPYGPADMSLEAPEEGGPFSTFFNSHRTGKGIHKWLQYFPAYQRHLGKFIGKEVHIMEIGIQSGGSLDMWKSVFGPGTHVYGCDINPECKAYEDTRTKVFIGDQASPEFWEGVKMQVPRIDILIDDGGHTPEQQIATLGLMLQHLSPDGVYITEDVHEVDNPFWQRLRFEQLDSPAGQHYRGLGNLVSSVHVYPFLLVIERNKNAIGASMIRQLGTSSSGQPPETRFVVSGGPPQSSKSLLPSHVERDLQSVFSWLHWSEEKPAGDKELAQLVSDMLPKGWLFVRDGNSRFSLSGKWDSQADEFMSNIISDFKPMHEGNCCNWNANDMQQSIESLHIYPHLLIAKRTDGKARLVKAPEHGTSWIPYMIEMDAEEKAGSPSRRIRRRGHRRHRHLLEEGFDDEGTIASEKDAKEKADSLSADEDDVQEVHGDKDMNTSKADMNTSEAGGWPPKITKVSSNSTQPHGESFLKSIFVEF